MRSTTLLSILLAATFTTAIPVTFEFDPIEGELASKTDKKAARVEGEATEKRVHAAGDIINNEYIPAMEHLLKDPTKKEHHEYIKAAVGPNYNVDQLRANVAMLKGEEAVVPMMSRFPDGEHPHATAFAHRYTDDNGKSVIDSVTGKATGLAVELGEPFFEPGRTPHDDADVLLHESIHQFAGGTDHMIKAGVAGNKNQVVYQDHLHQDLDIGNPRDSTDQKAKQNMINGGGYAHSVPIGNNRLRHATHQELIDKGPDVLKGSPYEKNRDKTDGMDGVPDAYVLLAGFGARHQKELAAKGAVCERSLYKRALTQDDPVGYYLAKRQQCTLPRSRAAPATTRNAAAGKSTRGAAKTGRAANPRNARTNRRVPVKKASNARIARKGRQGTRAARRQRAAGRGKRTGRGARGSRSSRVAKAGRRGRGSAAARSSRRKAVTGRKRPTASRKSRNNAAKTRKSRNARGNRRVPSKKASNARIARKGRKGTQAARRPRAAKKGANKGAKSNRKSVAKSRKNAKGRKTNTRAKGNKAANKRRGGKASKRRNGGSKAANKRKKGGKGANAKKGGGKAANRRKSGNTSKARSNKPKNGNASRAKKQNARKATNNKTKKQNARKAANNKASKSSNRRAANGRAAAQPKAQPKATRATPAAKVATPKRGGKRN